MMDEKLTILTLFCTFNLSVINFNIEKLTSLAITGKYNYSLLDRALSVKVNSLGNKFYSLVEVTRTYKTFSYCFISLIYFIILRNRMICVMLHLVNYSYIALSLGVKVRREIMKFAGNGATSLFGTKPNNKVYNNTVTMHNAGVILSNKSNWTGICRWGLLTPEPLQLLVKAWW